MNIESTDMFQMILENEQPEVDNIIVLGQHYREEIAKMLKKCYKVEMFYKLAKLTESQHVLLLHQGIIGIRKLTSDGSIETLLNSAHARSYISAKLIDKCLQIARQDTYKHLKNEACYLLANLLTDAEFCELIVEKKGIELMVLLFQNQKQQPILENVIWCLGNISADTSQHRDLLISNGGVGVLIQRIKSATKSGLIKKMVQVLQNICCTKPFKNFNQMNEVYQVMCEALLSGIIVQEDDNLVGILWSLSRLTDRKKIAQIQTVRNSGVLRLIFEHSVSDQYQVCLPSVNILGSFSAGTETQTEELISHGIFDVALCLINHHKETIRLKICIILSNIAAGSPKQKKALISETNLMRHLSLLLWQPDLIFKNEVMWLYGKLARQCPAPAQLIALILQQKVLEALVEMLNETDVNFLNNILEILGEFLNLGENNLMNNQNPLLNRIVHLPIVDKLEELQQNLNQDISGIALKIYQQYFQT